MGGKIWTDQEVADAFEQAIYTLKRLPKAIMLGYRSTWPAMVYTEMEVLQMDTKPMRLGPPNPAAIDRLDHILTWICWLEVDERKLIWARARRLPWRAICTQLGVGKTTAWQRWHAALDKIVDRLNDTKQRR